MPAADLPQSVDEEPAVCVRLSNKLVPYLLGLLEMYRWEDKLKGTPQEVVDGLGLFQNLLIALTEGNCTGDSMPFQLRQNPVNSCQLQQSLDGGQTWTLAFDYGQCQPDMNKARSPIEAQNYLAPMYEEQEQYLTDWNTNGYANIAPDFDYSTQTAPYLDQRKALCAALRAYIEIFFKYIIIKRENGIYDDYSAAENLVSDADTGLAMYGIMATLAIAPEPTSKVVLITTIASLVIGAVLSAAKEYDLAQLKETYDNPTMWDELTCQLVDYVGDQQPSAELLASACIMGVIGDNTPTAAAEWLTFAFDPDGYAAFIGYAQEVKDKMAQGVPVLCPCEPSCITVTPLTPQPSNLVFKTVQPTVTYFNDEACWQANRSGSFEVIEFEYTFNFACVVNKVSLRFRKLSYEPGPYTHATLGSLWLLYTNKASGLQTYTFNLSKSIAIGEKLWVRIRVPVGEAYLAQVFSFEICYTV